MAELGYIDVVLAKSPAGSFFLLTNTTHNNNKDPRQGTSCGVIFESFCTRVRVVWDSFVTLFGLVLEPVWTCFGLVLDQFCTCFGVRFASFGLALESFSSEVIKFKFKSQIMAKFGQNFGQIWPKCSFGHVTQPETGFSCR